MRLAYSCAVIFAAVVALISWPAAQVLADGCIGCEGFPVQAEVPFGDYIIPDPAIPVVQAVPVARPVSRPVVAPVASQGSVWDSLAACESGGNWGHSGGGFEGGVQFLHSTWVAAGGRRYAEHAYQATREQQIAIAEGWLAQTSWSQWPACSRRIGVR